MKKNVIVLIGCSASGKDSILTKLINNYNHFNFTNLVSHTTRLPRDNETNGIAYHFVNKEQFDSIEMIEQRHYNTLFKGVAQTWHYGLSSKELQDKLTSGKLPIVILDYTGLKEFQEYGHKNSIEVIPFYIQVNPIQRTLRCIKRGNFSWMEHIRRLIDDTKVFRGAKQECIVVKNKHIDLTIGRILNELTKRGLK